MENTYWSTWIKHWSTWKHWHGKHRHGNTEIENTDMENTDMENMAIHVSVFHVSVGVFQIAQFGCYIYLAQWLASRILVFWLTNFFWKEADSWQKHIYNDKVCQAGVPLISQRGPTYSLVQVHWNFPCSSFVQLPPFSQTSVQLVATY